MKEVAIILINYNTAKFTLQCLTSIAKKTDPSIDYQVIVVDNASAAADYDILKQGFPQDVRFQLHRSAVNTGFGGGNMYGVQYADATYFLFLNNDTLLENDCVSILKTYMDANPTVGVCTAQNYDEHGNHVPSFDHNKGLRRLLFGRSFLEKNWPKRYPKRKRSYDEPISVDWVNGAFMFFRKKVFEEVGGFDPAIFLYWEEMDICHRLKRKGYTSMLVPEAKVMHYQGKSIGTSKGINRESYISYLHVVRKNFGLLKYIAITTYLGIAMLLKPKKWYLLGTILNPNRKKNSLRLRQ